MKKIIVIVCCFLVAEYATSQVMASSFQGANHVNNFITAGMKIRYEMANPNSYGGTGTTITDLMGNSNATSYNTPNFSNSGIKNMAFVGASSHYLLTDTGIPTTNQQSIFMWVYPTGNGVLLDELGGASLNYSGWHDSQIEIVGGNQIYFGIWNYAGFPANKVSSVITLNTWHYVGYTYDGTTLKAYIDGAQVASSNCTRSIPANIYFGIGAQDTTYMLDGGYGDFKLNAFHYYNRALSLNEVKLNYVASQLAPNGLTSDMASTSAYQIKQDYPDSTDGFYWIKNANINSGVPFKIYADMTTNGGGWTLIMKNSSNTGWTYANSIALNTGMPFTTNSNVISTATANYSIIGWADYIKKSASGFQYMIDATNRGSSGGIWTANGTYSFTNTDNTQTNLTLNTKFGDWNYVTNNMGMEERMPWRSQTVGSGAGFLTLSDGVGYWWGTLIANNNNYSPSPWIYDGGGGTSNPNPGIIWYWVR